MKYRFWVAVGLVIVLGLMVVGMAIVGTMAEARGAKSYVPSGNLCIDNGAMIAYTGLLMVKAGAETPFSESTINQRFRTDEVDVVWRGQNG